jgi:hypothetical protein
MALSFVQEPIGDATLLPVITNWNPIVPYALHQDSSIAAFFYYKMVLEVRIGSSSGELLAKIKQRRNGNASDIASNLATAIFDIRDIANTQLKDTIMDQNDTTKSIHTLGANVIAKPFSHNTSQIATIYVKGYQNYSSAENTSPVDVTTGYQEDVKKYMAASLELQTARGTADFQDTEFSGYQIASATSKLLSDLQADDINEYGVADVRRSYVRSTDYHTIAFLNGIDDFNSSGFRVYIQYYDSSNATVGSLNSFTNSLTNGGAEPSSGGEVAKVTHMLIYFGVGPKNLERQSLTTAARPSNNSGWAYYKVYLALADGTQKSAPYYFVNQDESCKGFAVRRLGWRNSLGCYDYFNFKQKSTQTLDVTRNNYETMIGEFSSDMYSYTNSDRGKNTSNTTAVLKETINTDWISEADAVLLEGLLMSTNVNIIETTGTNGSRYTVPVMVTDSSFVKKTVANDKLIQYTINIEYANPINTNS